MNNSTLARSAATLALSLIALPWSIAGQQSAVRTPAQLSARARQALQTQVMLDRAGYSPGEIDAAMGSNTQRALAAFQKHGGNAQASPVDALAQYHITDQDAAGPFTPPLPADLEQQAQFQQLGYHDILEMLGERFHASPALLTRLNPGAKFGAGEDVTVPGVLNAIEPVATPGGRGATSPDNPAAVTVTVSRSESSLVVTDGSSHTLFFAPVTTGSEHDPLPLGEWKVRGVQHDPRFFYNPALFWDADPTHSKTVLQPGPNNPVGVVWIDLTREHYGIHGTPEPSQIGKTTSHGCVRLTNWDALKVASLVHPGTRVLFTE